MRVTISICTRNRAASLARTLDSLSRIEVPKGVVLDVLVVDNASSDGSVEAARSFARRFALRVESEPRAGLSHARNRVLDLAEGELLVWVDDDVTVSPGWLSACIDGLGRFPDAAFAGGPIVARFEGMSEKWVAAVEKSVGCAFGWYEPKIEEGEIRSDNLGLPWGANMAMRRAAVGDLRFDTGLGRQPGELVLSGEETSFCRTLVQRGHHGCWLPEMRLNHHISPERTNEEWIGAYFHGRGWETATRFERDNAVLEGLVALRRAKLERYDRWHRRLRYRFSPLARRLLEMGDREELRGFIEGARERTKGLLAQHGG